MKNDKFILIKMKFLYRTLQVIFVGSNKPFGIQKQELPIAAIILLDQDKMSNFCKGPAK
jgi:hypothetical protein